MIPPIAAGTSATRRRADSESRRGSALVNWLTTTDHKLIGQLYLITAFGFFLLAGIMALMMRAELARPGLQFLTNEEYNQLFTMHGAIMLLLFATPLFIGFANVIVPLRLFCGPRFLRVSNGVRAATGTASVIAVHGTGGCCRRVTLPVRQRIVDESPNSHITPCRPAPFSCFKPGRSRSR